MITRDQIIFIIFIIFVVFGFGVAIIGTLANRAEVDRIIQNETKYFDNRSLDYMFVTVDPITHENGTLYNCEELNQMLGELLVYCDDFSDSNNDTWAVYIIDTPTPSAGDQS